MYYQSFYSPVRPFDPPVLGPGRERGEIPLDLSLKAVRQDATDADDLMLLEQRKLAQLAGTLSRQLPGGVSGSSLLDPTLFRLPYGASHPGLLHTMTSPFCPPVSTTTSFATHPMMSSLLQQQRDSSGPQSMSSFLDPSAALSLHALRPTVTTTNAGSTRGLFPPTMPTSLGLPSYSLYPDIFSEAARRREEKGAFTAIRNAEADAARYVDHLQRLREQHLQTKCTSACCVPIPGLSQTTQAPCVCCIPSSPSHPSLCSRNPMAPCLTKDHKMCNGPCSMFNPGLSLLTPRPTTGDVRLPVNPYCPPLGDASRREESNGASLFTPSTLWNGGLPTLPVAPTPAQPQKKKEGANVNQKESPRAARDFPGPPLFDKSRCTPPDRKESAFKSTVPTAARMEPRPKKEHNDVVLVEESASSTTNAKPVFPAVSEKKQHNHHHHHHHHHHHTSATSHHRHQESQDDQISRSHHTFKHTSIATNTTTTTTTTNTPQIQLHPQLPLQAHPPPHFIPSSKPCSTNRSDENIAPPTRMPRLEAVKPTESVSAPRSTSPQEPPPLIAAVASSNTPTDIPVSQFGLPLPYPIPRMPEPSSSGVPPPPPPPPLPTSVASINYSHFAATPSDRPSDFAPVTPMMYPPKLMLSPKVNGYGSSPARESSPHPYTPVNRIPDMTMSAQVAFESSSPAQAATAPHSQPLPHQETSQERIECVAPVATPAEEVSGCDEENVLKKLLTRTSISTPRDSPTVRTLADTNKHPNPEPAEVQRRTPPVLETSARDITKPRKRSMLECLASSEGYVAEKKRPKTTDLFADPSQLGREERALQRAMLQFEDLGGHGGRSSSPNTKLCKTTTQDSEVSNVQTQEQTLSLKFSSQNLPKSYKSTKDHNSNRREVNRFTGFRAKRKLPKSLLAKLYKERRNSATGAKSRGTQQSERQTVSRLSLRWRQRRLIQAARRRRFRSGLDMIRSHRRKKSRTSSSIRLQRQALTIESRQRVSTQEKTGDDNAPKNSSESSTGPIVPPEIKRLMVNKALGETILHRAARLGYPDVVLYCLETKACGVNARDNAGYTPLHECCSRGHLEIARALLQYGADVNASAAGGIRPLHDAVENDHVELVRLLLAYGADPTIATYSGLTPLKLARSPIMVEFLRGFLADITGETDGHPVLPWKFAGSASCLDPEDSGYDVFDNVPCDGDTEESDDFLFEVSDAPLLPTFRLQLPDSKALCNCLRLSDVLKQCGMNRETFTSVHSHVEIFTIPRHQFESSATCSQLLTGSKLDTLLARDDHHLDNGHMIDVVKLDDHIREILGIETIALR